MVHAKFSIVQPLPKDLDKEHAKAIEPLLSSGQTEHSLRNVLGEVKAKETLRFLFDHGLLQCKLYGPTGPLFRDDDDNSKAEKEDEATVVFRTLVRNKLKPHFTWIDDISQLVVEYLLQHPTFRLVWSDFASVPSFSAETSPSRTEFKCIHGGAAAISQLDRGGRIRLKIAPHERKLVLCSTISKKPPPLSLTEAEAGNIVSGFSDNLAVGVEWMDWYYPDDSHVAIAYGRGTFVDKIRTIEIDGNVACVYPHVYFGEFDDNNNNIKAPCLRDDTTESEHPASCLLSCRVIDGCVDGNGAVPDYQLAVPRSCRLRRSLAGSKRKAGVVFVSDGGDTFAEVVQPPQQQQHVFEGKEQFSMAVPRKIEPGRRLKITIKTSPGGVGKVIVCHDWIEKLGSHAPRTIQQFYAARMVDWIEFHRISDSIVSVKYGYDGGGDDDDDKPKVCHVVKTTLPPDREGGPFAYVFVTHIHHENNNPLAFRCVAKFVV